MSTIAIITDRKHVDATRARIEFDDKFEVDMDARYRFGGSWSVCISQPNWSDRVVVNQDDYDHLSRIVRMHNAAVREDQAQEFRERNMRMQQRMREELAAKAAAEKAAAVEKAAAEKRRAERAALAAAKDEAARRLSLLNTLSTSVPSNSFSEGYARALRDVLTA